MKTLSVFAAILVMAAPAFAQREHGYVEGLGGFAVSASAPTASVRAGNAGVEAGIGIAPHLQLFANAGRYNDLSPGTVQQTLTDTTTALASNDALDVVGSARMPAKYMTGGLRWEVPVRGRASPFVLGGMGFARLTPTLSFIYTDGTLPNADPSMSPPAVGADVTQPIELAGLFSQPAPSTEFMTTLGGGVDVNVAKHWTVDSAYRFSRIAADTPLHAQGLTFGFGYRF